MKTNRELAQSIMRSIAPLAYFPGPATVSTALDTIEGQVALQKNLALIIGFCTGIATAGIFALVISQFMR